MSDTLNDPPVPTGTLLTIGPTLVGSLISYALFGISVMQIYLYHINFPRDSWKLKALVYVVFSLDIFQSVAVAILCWHTLVSGWGRPSALLFPGWTFSAVPAASGIVALFVQTFYAWRIYLLGHWRSIPGVIIFFALAQCAAALAIAIGFVPLKNVELLHKPNMNARTIVWLGGAALTDLIVSISMLYLLYGARHSRFSETQRMIERLIRLTIETGVATATTAVIELIFFLSFPPSSGMHLLAALSLCKVYSNALMTSLNSRAVGASKHTSSIGGTFQRSGTTSRSYSSTGKEGAGRSAVVHVHTSTATASDTFDGDRSSTGKHASQDPSLIELGQFRTKMSQEI